MAHYTSFDKLLEAMSKIADTSDSKLKYDKTVVMEIIQLVDASIGEYAVKYQGNTLQAFTKNLDDKYSVGDSVYVKIPEGDFTNQKIIESKVSKSSSDEQERNIISNTIMDIEPSWFSEKMYGALDEPPSSLVSGGEIRTQAIWNRINKDSTTLDSADTLLTLYNKEYDKIIIKASFMNSFLGTHLQGNYGIRLNLRIVDILEESKNNTIIQSFDLDTTCFTGNIYNLSSYSPQYAVFQIPKNSLLGVESLEFFQEDMEKDIWTKGTEKEEIVNPNIYVKDISVNFVEVLDYTQDNYYLLIDTPNGNTLDNDSAEVTAVPRLIYKGDNVISDSSCEVYWYKENPDALIGTQMYSAQAGCGWELLDSENTLTISGNKVIIEQRYKVLVLYGKKQSPFSKIITIYKKNAEDDGTELLRETIKDKDYLYIKNSEYKGTWYRELPNGSYINLSDENYQIEDEESTTIRVITGKDKDNKDVIAELKAFNRINITSLLSYSSFTIYCKIYKNGQFLVTRHYDITNLGEETDITVTFEGEKVFRYDANGDIAIEDSEKEQTINGKIAWREGAGAAFKVEWVDGNGVSIGATDTPLENSMLKNVYVDNYNILHYTIRPKYYNYYQNNSLTMKIITIDGKTYDFPCDILFVKDGEPGTNGTTYITMIRPVKLVENKYELDTDYKVMHGQNQAFKAYVYKDGSQIESDSNYELLFDWSAEGFNLPSLGSEKTYGQIINIDTPKNAPEPDTVTKEIPKLDPMGRPTGEVDTVTETTGYYAPRGYILKVAVTIRDKSTEGQRSVKIYYNLPLAVVFGNSEFDSSTFNTNIPNFIQYESDGSIASYKYEELYVTYNGTEQILKDEILSYAKDAINITNIDGKYYLQPVNNYYYQTGSAGIQIKLPDNGYIVYSIMMYRNTFGNNYINGWDGTSLKLDEGNNYLLAAMAGAGRKNSDNTFTGVVMGTIKNGDTEKDGLFGYNQGQQTFSLDAETGDATFGVNKEIIITPKEATIKGNSTNGFMELKLIPTKDTDNAIEVKYNEETKFSVDYTGKMTATEADITGKITSDEGIIGGWTINKTSIYAGDENSLKTIISSINGIQTEQIALGSDFTWGTNDVFLEPRGYIGNMTLDDGDDSLGISSTNSFAIRTGANGLNSSGTGAYLKVMDRGYVMLGPSITFSGGEGSYLKCNIDADKQSGIYARFA